MCWSWLSGCKPVSTPMEQNHKLTIVDYDKHVGNTGDAPLEDACGYEKLIGKLLYLTITRPVICFAVQVLSQFMQSPKESNMEKLKKQQTVSRSFAEAEYKSVATVVAEAIWMTSLLKELENNVEEP
uniref:Uncharacterized protein LOC104217572 n=1 Tax=Nicotiana sylvestris TaxID=4096 RepID=A0A1U7VIJ1_NICSY